MAHTFWLTGIPGAGKTIAALTTERRLIADWGQKVVVVDGDAWRDARHNHDYTEGGRRGNVIELARFAQTLNRLGYQVIVPTCSPQQEIRDCARQHVRHFHEVYLYCDEATARRRVPDRYAKADSGVYQNYPVVHTRYEEPAEPECRIDGTRGLSEVMDELFSYIVHVLEAERRR